MIYYLIVLFGVFACSASQLLLKSSAITEHRSVISEILNWRVIVAYAVMFATLLANIYSMSRGVMLKDLPILEATGYVFVPVLSFIFFKERVSYHNIISISLIIFGIFIFYN